nr:MAG TPA: hypothetical protein [Caudoviricetes sp.]
MSVILKYGVGINFPTPIIFCKTPLFQLYTIVVNRSQ